MSLCIRRGAPRRTAQSPLPALDAMGRANAQRQTGVPRSSTSPSNHILEKLRFRFDGDALERGTPVWRWALRRPPDARIGARSGS